MILHTTAPHSSPNETTSPTAFEEPALSPALRWAFYAFMFSLPYDVVNPSWLPTWLQGNLSIPRITGVILVLMFVLRTRPRLWRLPLAFIAFAAFFLVFALSMLGSSFASFTVVFQQFQMILSFAVAYNLFLTGRATRGALLAFSVSCGVSSVFVLTGTTAAVSQVEALGERIAGFGADPNIYSAVLMVGVVTAIGIGHFGQQRSMLLSLILWPIAFLTTTAIALSGSRGSTLGLAVGLATFMLCKGSLRVRMRRLVILALVGGVAVWTAFSTPVLVDRWKTTIETGNTSSRNLIVAQAITMVKEKPLFGWGPQATIELGARFSLPARATHDMPLTMLTYVGLLGALPYFWAYFAVLRAAWRARSGNENVVPLAIFMALFVTDMITGGLPDKLHWTIFAYVLAAGRFVDLAPQPSPIAGVPQLDSAPSPQNPFSSDENEASHADMACINEFPCPRGAGIRGPMK